MVTAWICNSSLPLHCNSHAALAAMKNGTYSVNVCSCTSSSRGSLTSRFSDKAELLKITGVAIEEGDDPHKVNLFYLPPHEGGQRAAWKGPTAYHFRIAIPIKYPFVPPTWKWVSRPLQKPHRCLGPDGVVSVEALSQWTPANSLSNVLISLFPSCTLADQCSSVTSHLWNLKVRALVCFKVLSTSLTVQLSIVWHS